MYSLFGVGWFSIQVKTRSSVTEFLKVFSIPLFATFIPGMEAVIEKYCPSVNAQFEKWEAALVDTCRIYLTEYQNSMQDELCGSAEMPCIQRVSYANGTFA